MHWAKDCPHNEKEIKKVNKDYEAEIILNNLEGVDNGKITLLCQTIGSTFLEYA